MRNKILAIAITLLGLLIACTQPLTLPATQTPRVVTAFVTTTPEPSLTPPTTATLTSTASPTCQPLPSYMTPGATLIVHPEKTITGTLESLVLQTYINKFRQGHEVPAVIVKGNNFGIEIVDGSIDPNWATTLPITNTTKTFSAFLSYDSRPPPPANDFDEWFKWFTSRKVLIRDLEKNKIHWVKWEDYLPLRPIDLEGWVTDDIFAFSQFGNPWHGFLIAIEAKTKMVLFTLQLEFLC